MSRERFEWLERWVADPDDVVRTPGTESNVKEIYDACRELAADPTNVILNQFAEFGNHVVHYLVHRRARSSASSSRCAPRIRQLRLRAFVSATGSAGHDRRRRLPEGAATAPLIVAAEALECPTMLRNGFGEHNIQGIGDKHIPLIHNVLNTDVVAGRLRPRHRPARRRSSAPTSGRRYLAARRGVPERAGRAARLARPLEHLQRARRDQDREAARARAGRRHRDGRDRRRRHVRQRARAGARASTSPTGSTRSPRPRSFGEHVLGATTDNLLRADARGARADLQPRLLHVGRAAGRLARGLRGSARPGLLGRRARRRRVWDELIDEFNARTGVLEAL